MLIIGVWNISTECAIPAALYRIFYIRIPLGLPVNADAKGVFSYQPWANALGSRTTSEIKP
jgi:hypothetical protein